MKSASRFHPPASGHPPASRIALAASIAALAFGYSYVHLAREGFTPDFVYPWRAARALLAGENPYDVLPGGQAHPFEAPLLYPIPAVLAVLPLAPLELPLAGATFIALSSGLLAYAIARTGIHRLPMFLSAPFYLAASLGQWSPLLTAAALWPALGFFSVTKPNLGIAAIVYRPARVAVIGALALCITSLLVLPGWPMEWIGAVRQDRAINGHPVPLLQPGGFILLLALLRWRRAEARLLLAMACIPQLLFYYDQLLLWTIPRTLRQSLVLTLSSMIAFVAWRALLSPEDHYGLAAAPYVLALIYLPALVMVMRLPPKEADPGGERLAAGESGAGQSESESPSHQRSVVRDQSNRRPTTDC